MLPILLVVSFVAPHAWGAQATTPAMAGLLVQAAAPAVAATTVPEAPPVEQARPSTVAREAERAKAQAQLELVEKARAALLEQANERDNVRELGEQSDGRRQAARARDRLQLETAVATANSTLEQAELHYTADQELNKIGLLAALQLKQSQANVERARGALASLIREAEAARAIETRRATQEVTQEVARRQLRRARGENELTMLETKLRLAEAALSRQRELVEKGLATRQSLVVAEEELLQLRIQLEQAKAHRMLAQDLESRAHEMRELLERESAAHRNLSMLNAGAALQPEDRLTITIDDEPDLPSTFTVRADGSIRFPFLGSIRVQGSTTSQVQSAIQKLISDKGLARNPVVTVSAHRAR